MIYEFEMKESYLVGARYSKSGLNTLLNLGFKYEEIYRGRCNKCNCKVMIHTDSAQTFADAILICGSCYKSLVAEGRRFIVTPSPNSEAIFKRAAEHIKKN